MFHFGYLDPGTGSMFIQALFGVFLAVGVIFRNSIGRVFRKLKVGFSRKSVNEED